MSSKLDILISLHTMKSTNMNVIEVNNITKHYLLGTQTVEALRGVSFGIKQENL